MLILRMARMKLFACNVIHGYIEGEQKKVHHSRMICMHKN